MLNLYYWTYLLSFIVLIQLTYSTDCQNGGTLNPDNTCTCYDYFQQPDCSKIQCLNKGYIPDDSTTKDRCLCPVGYYGQYCESYKEVIPQKNLFQIPKHKLVHFVNVEITNNNNPWPNYLSAIFFDPAFKNDLYQEYYLYGYNISSDAINYGSDTVLSKNDFINKINNSDFIFIQNKSNCKNVSLFKSLYDFIVKQQLSQTSINIFSMYPSDDQSLDDVINIALAFNIRINVYFAYSGFLCLNSDTDTTVFKKVAFKTGGTYFSFENPYTTLQTLIDFTSMTSNIQLNNFMYSNSISSNTINKTVYMPGDGTLIPYIITSASNVSSSNCGLFLKDSSNLNVDNINIYYIYGDRQCVFSANYENGNNHFFQTVSASTDPKNLFSGVQMYITFTDDPSIDSSYYSLKEEIPLYVRIHIENFSQNNQNRTYTILNATYHTDNDLLTNLTFSKHDATFEFISEQPLTCESNSYFKWVEVVYVTHDLYTNYTEARYIPVECTPSLILSTTTKEMFTNTEPFLIHTTDNSFSSDSSSVVYDTTNILSTETSMPATETSIPVTTENPSSCYPSINNRDNLPSLIIALSNSYPLSKIQDLITGVYGLDPSFAESNYKNFIQVTYDFLNFDYQTTKYATDNYTQFMISIHNTSYGPYQNLPSDSTILDLLLDILKDPDVSPNSAVTILTSDITDINENNKIIEILQHATTKQIKFNIIMDISYFTSYAIENLKLQPKFGFYDQLAAITDGHFMITKTDALFSNNGTYAVANYFVSFHNNAFNNKLASSIVVPFTQNEIYIGTLDLLTCNGNRKVFISAYNGDNTFLTFMMITITDNNNSSNSILTYYTADNSNFKTNVAYITIPNDIQCGTTYSIKISSVVNQALNDTTLAYRVWLLREKEDYFNFDITYMDSTNNYDPVNGPRYDILASPKININGLIVDDIDNISTNFYDCNGNYLPVYDNYNQATISEEKNECNTIFYINPFECKGDQKCDISFLNGYYTMNITINTKSGKIHKQIAHFWCDFDSHNTECFPNSSSFKIDSLNADTQETTTVESETTTILETTTDIPDTSCQCFTDTVPHLRGPYCTVPDCSKNGNLYFNETNKKYECTCRNDYFGDFCELATCSSQVYPTVIDPKYKTLTIALIYSTLSDLTSIFETIKVLSSFGSVEYFNIFGSCRGGTPQQLYFGTSSSDFISTIILNAEYQNRVDLMNYCGTDDEINLTNIVKYGLKYYGKEPKGLLWIVTHDSYNIYFDNSTDTDLDTYYRIIQGYKQEIYVTSVINDDNPSTDMINNYYTTLNAIRVTGGDRIDLQNYPDNKNVLETYFENLLNKNTAINYYEIIDRTITDNINIDGDSAYLLLSGPNASLIKLSNDCELLISSGLTYLFSCTKISTVPLKVDDNLSPTYVSARVINSIYTPVWTLVNETKQDDLEAFPVVGTNPTLAFTIIGRTNNDKLSDITPDHYGRLVEHQNCRFENTSTFQVPLTNPGYSYFKLNITAEDNVYYKYIPFVVTSDFTTDRCQNGGSIEGIDAKCHCPDQWSGPDCSRPVCSGGSLNTMQNACYCHGENYGRTCSNSIFDNFY